MMNQSSYEYHIIKILNREHISFVREKTFPDLFQGKYRYDFYIPNYCGRPLLIEVDGEQHFNQVSHFQKKGSDLLKTKEHDRRKNSYALAHKITLIRIPYWEIANINNIEDIFQEKFVVKNKDHNDRIKVPPK